MLSPKLEKQIIRVCGKNFERNDIPAFIRNQIDEDIETLQDYNEAMEEGAVLESERLEFEQRRDLEESVL